MSYRNSFNESPPLDPRIWSPLTPDGLDTLSFYRSMIQTSGQVEPIDLTLGAHHNTQITASRAEQHSREDKRFVFGIQER